MMIKQGGQPVGTTFAPSAPAVKVGKGLLVAASTSFLSSIVHNSRLPELQRVSIVLISALAPSSIRT